MELKKIDTRNNFLSKLGKEAGEMAEKIYKSLRGTEAIDYVNYVEIFCNIEKTTEKIKDQMEFFYQYIMYPDFDILLSKAKSGEISFKMLDDKNYIIDIDEFVEVYDSPINSRISTIDTMVDSLILLNRLSMDFIKRGIEDKDKEILFNMYDLAQEISFNMYYTNADYIDFLQMLGIENKEVMEIRQEI